MTIRDYQEEQLFILIRAAKGTTFGKKYHFADLQRYENFRATVPISFYEDIKSDIEQLKQNKADLFWPGSINKFAVSAGTSSSGKHLPLTEARLQSDKQFMKQVVYNYLKQRPNIFNLWGDHIGLPGNLERQGAIEVGEISAFSSQKIPWWLRPFQLVDSRELVRLPFKKKIDHIVDNIRDKDIRVCSAAPSWLLTIFQRLLQETNAESISELWPKLQLLVCGGVKLDSYRTHLQRLIGNNTVDFVETYGASEGYFAFTNDLKRKDMKLVINNGIFYEFVPHPLPDQESLSIQEPIPLWEVEPATPYAMLVSTNAGLWRYPLNDIVQFTQTDPPRIEVMGRVSEMLDDYGEALYAYEAEQALQEASSRLEIKVGPFTIAANLEDESSIPNHLWFIAIEYPVHRDTLNRLAHEIDAQIQQKNRHYAIRRESGALAMPEVYSITQQQINNWLKERGKLKAQGKLPAILTKEKDIRFFK